MESDEFDHTEERIFPTGEQDIFVLVVGNTIEPAIYGDHYAILLEGLHNDPDVLIPIPVIDPKYCGFVLYKKLPTSKKIILGMCFYPLTNDERTLTERLIN